MSNAAIRDDALIEALCRGDESALELIIERYTAYVWTVVWNIVRGRLDRSDAKGIVSDVFYTLWKNAPNIRPWRLKGYLASIARSRAVDALRRAKQELTLEEDIIEIPVSSPETAAMRQEEYAALRRAVESLPEPDREIFLRHYYLYQKVSDIAAVMDINVNTVKTKLRRGRDILRRELTEGGYFVG